ncbi:MAG: pyridoxamine 5'-phosphate oxidase family protein [Candidatus Omnitrophica bacterium]|nr:pyridoxamine 5'-phosphate oxidase family protein [Candidatus Omnitrophota bacterium]
MKRIPDNIVNFLQEQGCVIVSSIDKNGFPHNACKGIVQIKRSGEIFLFDLYKGKTYENLQKNPCMSITAVNEHKFVGYSLKGKARILTHDELKTELIKAWEDRITSRLTQRMLKNIREEKGHPGHPEALLPQPEYIIVMEVEDLIDLTPHHLK